MIITNSKLNNKELTQVECYYNIIKECENEIPKDGNYVIKISFDNINKIYFIHPLFLVYLLNFYEKLQSDEKYNYRDLRIIFDIENLDNKVQEYIHTYLTQYFDCQVIEIVDKYYKNKESVPSLFTDKKFLLYTSIQENSLTLLKKQGYNFLPIVKISNNDFIENFLDREYWITESGEVEVTKENELVYEKKHKKIDNLNRYKFYENLLLDGSENERYRLKSEKVWEEIFEVYLELTMNGAYITNKFKEIFREIVENIQKHTELKGKVSNGYISFYKDTHKDKDKKHNQFELIVSDDYKRGFLTKYEEVINEEYKNLFNSNYNKELSEIAKEEYESIFKDFDNENYESILKKIFNLELLFSAQSKRITKHFGIPLLLKIVLQLENLSLKQLKKNYVSLKIYLNKDEKSFQIVCESGMVSVYPLLDNSIRGTYIHVSFPEKLHLDDPKESTKLPLILKTKNYQDLFLQKDEIQKESISKFQKVTMDDVIKKTPLEENKESLVIDYKPEGLQIGDYLRYTYLYAFYYSIKDILIVNFPIEDNNDYLLVLLETTDIKSIVNIVFLNKDYPQALFIGGSSVKDSYHINCKLSQSYNYNRRNFVENIEW